MNELSHNNKNINNIAKQIITAILSIFIIISIFYFIITTVKKDNNLQKSSSIANFQNAAVMVYYFHRTSRCNTCITIEKLSHEVIQNNFKNELQLNKLKFIPLNIELNENKHFVQDLNLSFNSLIVTLIRNSKIVKYKNLEDVWNYYEDKEKFASYVIENIKIYLDEI